MKWSSGCGAVVAHTFWELVHAGSNPVTPTILETFALAKTALCKIWNNSSSSCSAKTAIYSEKFYILQLFGVNMESKPVKVLGRPAKTDAPFWG